MKVLFPILLFLLIQTPISYAKNWVKVSREIKQKQKELIHEDDYNTLFFIEQYKICRNKINIFNKLDISTKSDTIYILERHSDGSDNTTISTAWNDKSEISYIQETPKDSIKLIANTNYFTTHIKNLSSKWKIDELRKEEKSHGNLIPNEKIFLTRIILIKKKVKIECLFFNFFFLFERDLYDN